MGSGILPISILLYSLLLLESLRTTVGVRKLMLEEHNHLQLPGHQGGISPDRNPKNVDPELNLFFYYNDLRAGNKIPIYFPTKDPSTTPHLLSMSESDSIPFSSSHLPYILRFFSFPDDSKQALAMKTTLHHCEFPPLSGETKFCATSLESMLDSVQKTFGSNSKFTVRTTNYLSRTIPPLQNYTVSEPPEEIEAQKILGCHKLPYPYAVFYCHAQAGDRKLYKVLLEGDDEGRVDAMAMCHMDTSQWDPNHVAFRVLKTIPGGSPVCHFFPADNLVWVPTS